MSDAAARRARPPRSPERFVPRPGIGRCAPIPDKDRRKAREERRAHLRAIADRLNADAREYPLDDASWRVAVAERPLPSPRVHGVVMGLAVAMMARVREPAV